MGHIRNKAAKKAAYKEKLIQQKKDHKKLMQEKRAKLFVKNIPFNSTPENLKEHFEKYGTVKDVNILKNPDGKLKGCCFIQFERVQSAHKAKHYTNGKEFLGRIIHTDSAVPKDDYKKKNANKVIEIKESPDDLDNSLIKPEDIKQEDEEMDEEKDSNIKGKDSDEDDSDAETDSDEDDEDDEDVKVDVKEEVDSKADIKPDIVNGVRKPHVISNDVTEGKTVFVKNIPFEATKEDLKECMKQFGPVYYALICIDRLTEHSKGTGFVKFVNKEDADKCLQAGTELTLLGNILDPHLALNKNDITQKIEKEKAKPKDLRNLYLVKEGVILAGSKSADGVSAADMAKRLQLEQYKTQMLRNLNMFISTNRLIIHNLPATWNDAKLRELLKKHAGPKAVITEAKIMRDMRNVDDKGIGKSKEYGFVTFTMHEHALNALRSLNNNPNIFTPAKRPIVAFSIENRVMIKTKQKRLEKSRQANPLSKDYVNNESKPQSNEEQPSNVKKNKRQFARFKKDKIKDPNKPNFKPRVVQGDEKYTGVAAKPGVSKMRSRHNLKSQAQLHLVSMKADKKKKKMAMLKSLPSIKQPQQKVNVKVERDNFSQMVNNYKKTLFAAKSNSTEKKGKWYE